jgi:hypothetical protein
MCPDCVRMPLCGVLWVALDVALVSLGIRIHWPFACAFMAGLGVGLSRGGIAAIGALGGLIFRPRELLFVNNRYGGTRWRGILSALLPDECHA